MLKKHSAIAAVVLAAGIAIAGAVPAYAADSKAGSTTCGTKSWSWTGANATASTVHRHENDGQWKEASRAAGVSSFDGWYQPGGVYMTLKTSGSFSSHVFGCTGNA